MKGVSAMLTVWKG